MPSTEKAFQRKVLQYLRERGGWWRKMSPLPYGHTGDPDIIGCYHGVFVSIELKAPGKYKDPEKGATALQKEVLDDIALCGGVTLVVDSLEPIIQELDSLDRVHLW